MNLIQQLFAAALVREPMQPVHRAAYEGDEAVVRLVQEDAGRLNAWVSDKVESGPGDPYFYGMTSLMLAAYKGHDALVARLLALGADVEFESLSEMRAVSYACMGNHASSLALLLDAGASIGQHYHMSSSLFMDAVESGAAECVALLISRGGAGLDVNVNNVTETVLCCTSPSPRAILRS